MPTIPSTEPDGAADHRQRHTLGEELPDDACPTGADRRAQRNLALAGCRAHQQQVRDVGARDEQNKCNGRAQDEQRRTRVPHEDLLKRLDTEAVVLLQRLGKFRAEVLRRQLQLRLRLFERDVWLEARGRLEEVPLIDRVRIELKRDPEIGCLAELRDVELRSDDANHDIADRRSARASCR